MVSVLIVNYYTGKWLPPLLDRLLPDTLVKEILILNNSPEERLEKVAGLEKVRVVDMGENLGFGRAMNRGAAMAQGDWWLLINPDTLPEPGCVNALVHAAQAQRVLVTGPRFYWDEGKSWRLPPATGETFFSLKGQQAAHQHALDFQVWRLHFQQQFQWFWHQARPFSQPFLSGACLLIRNDPSWFPDGHIFDERFFLYYEDTDLSARMLLNKQVMLCVPEAEAVHYWDQSPRGEKGAHMEASLTAYLDKYYPGATTDIPLGEGTGFPIPEIEDWGKLAQSPVFGTTGFDVPHVLELGVSPLMIPRVQRELIPGDAWMPPQTWIGLSPGQYYSQIRPVGSPYPIKQWTWKKA